MNENHIRCKINQEFNDVVIMDNQKCVGKERFQWMNGANGKLQLKEFLTMGQ